MKIAKFMISKIIRILPDPALGLKAVFKLSITFSKLKKPFLVLFVSSSIVRLSLIKHKVYTTPKIDNPQEMPKFR